LKVVLSMILPTRKSAARRTAASSAGAARMLGMRLCVKDKNPHRIRQID
jgi:hypothetical protein